MLRRVANERAPARSDVEEPITRLQAELPAYHVELVALGFGNILVPVRLEVGTGVDHVVIEEELIEGVGDVVVVGDVALVDCRLSGSCVGIFLDRVEKPWRPLWCTPELEACPQQPDDAELAQHAADLAIRPL